MREPGNARDLFDKFLKLLNIESKSLEQHDGHSFFLYIWYWVVLDGLVWCWIFLDVLDGVGWYGMVLDGIVRYWKV